MSHSSEGSQGSTIYVESQSHGPLTPGNQAEEKPVPTMEEQVAAAKATVNRNVDSCDVQIISLTGRIAGAGRSGEDAKDLQKRLDGYKAKRAEILKKAKDAGLVVEEVVEE